MSSISTSTATTTEFEIETSSELHISIQSLSTTNILTNEPGTVESSNPVISSSFSTLFSTYDAETSPDYVYSASSSSLLTKQTSKITATYEIDTETSTDSIYSPSSISSTEKNTIEPETESLKPFYSLSSSSAISILSTDEQETRSSLDPINTKSSSIKTTEDLATNEPSIISSLDPMYSSLSITTKTMTKEPDTSLEPVTTFSLSSTTTDTFTKETNAPETQSPSFVPVHSTSNIVSEQPETESSLDPVASSSSFSLFSQTTITTGEFETGAHSDHVHLSTLASITNEPEPGSSLEPSSSFYSYTTNKPETGSPPEPINTSTPFLTTIVKSTTESEIESSEPFYTSLQSSTKNFASTSEPEIVSTLDPIYSSPPS